LRVIAGTYRSRPLSALRGLQTRPTSDRLRETLFNILTAGNPQALEGSVWLDLYAGTGAVGIEALSRGAGKVYFVDSSAKAAGLIRQNLHSLDIRDGFDVIEDDISRAIWTLQRQRASPDIVFLDPPYRSTDEYGRTLRALEDAELLWAMSLVIAEHDRHFDPGDKCRQLRRFRKTVQGDSALSFYRQGTVPAML